MTTEIKDGKQTTLTIGSFGNAICNDGYGIQEKARGFADGGAYAVLKGMYSERATSYRQEEYSHEGEICFLLTKYYQIKKHSDLGENGDESFFAMFHCDRCDGFNYYDIDDYVLSEIPSEVLQGERLEVESRKLFYRDEWWVKDGTTDFFIFDESKYDKILREATMISNNDDNFAEKFTRSELSKFKLKPDNETLLVIYEDGEEQLIQVTINEDSFEIDYQLLHARKFCSLDDDDNYYMRQYLDHIEGLDDDALNYFREHLLDEIAEEDEWDIKN